MRNLNPIRLWRRRQVRKRRERRMRAIARALLTPTAWGTVAGGLLAAYGHPALGGALLAIVGWGGVGIALALGIQRDRQPWWWPTVLEEWVEMFTGRSWPAAVGVLTHLPQGIIGLWLLGS